jgi:signal transduction histidine kinase
MSRGPWQLWVLAGLVPALPLALLVWSSFPATDGENVRSLVGAWKAHDGPLQGAGAPALDDAAWLTVRLPGALRPQGITGTEAWFRQRVELSAFDPSERFFVSFGNVRCAMLDLYVNGTLVGREESVTNYQTNLMQKNGWSVPPGLLNPGQNLVAAHLWWAADAAQPAVLEPRLLLGPARSIEAEFLRMRTLHTFLIDGATFLLVLAVPMLLVLRAIETRPLERKKHARGALMALGTVLYTGWLSGLGMALVPLPSLPETAWVRVSLVALIAAPWGFWEYFDVYVLGGISTLGRVNRVVSSLLILLVLIGAVSGVELISVYLSLPLVYMVVLNTRHLVKQPSVRSFAHFSVVVCVSGAAVLDLLVNLSLLDLGDLSGAAFANVAIVITAVLLSDFVDYSRQNHVLTVSLAERNEALGEALGRAVEADRLKGEFLSTMSHELRTPLNAIVNVPPGLLADFAQNPGLRCPGCGAQFGAEGAQAPAQEGALCPTCRQQPLVAQASWRYEGDPAAAVRHLSLIERAGTQLLGLVTDILDYTNLQAGRSAPATHRIDVGPVLAAVTDRLAPLAASRKVAVGATVSPDALALIDPDHLASIVEKLLKNAIQFSAEGGLVEVSVETSDDRLVLRVRDSGMGIAPENHQRIFKAFHQVEGGSTRRYGGVGLGLALAKSMAEASGGRIGVDSQLGAGSTFWVEVPGGGAAPRNASEAST